MSVNRASRIFFLICSAAFGLSGATFGGGAVTSGKLIMYAAFLPFLCMFIRDAMHNRPQKKYSYIDLLLASVFLYDNYIIILISLLWPIAFNKKDTTPKKWTIKKYTFFVSYYLIVNIIMNFVKPVNILFFTIYISSFYLLLKFFRRVQLDSNLYIYFLNNIYFFITSQLLPIIITIIVYPAGTSGPDWVTGTLGYVQQNVLMFIHVNFAIFLLNDYMRFGRRKSLVFFLISLVILLSTGSITYTLVLLSAICFMEITNRNINLRYRIYLLILLLICMAVVFTVASTWVINDVLSLTNKEYFEQRVTKIYAYQDVFINLPSDYNYLISIIGVGIGQYSSRAALTCSGTYIDSYSSFFPVSVTEYTQKYILNAPKRSNSIGLASTPYSVIVSVQGELGLIGLLILAHFFVKLFHSSKSFYEKLIVLFFVGIMFVDNSIEFAKYCVAFWLSLKFCRFSLSIPKNEDRTTH